MNVGALTHTVGLGMQVATAATAIALGTAQPIPIPVSLNVTVTDRASHYVTNLQAGDLSVIEDGVKQDVTSFVLAQQRRIALLLDTSASMERKLATHTSKNSTRDGKRRRVGVRVNRPNLTIRTKQGYFAPTGR